MGGILLGAALPPPHSVSNNTEAEEKNQEKRREQSIQRCKRISERNVELDLRTSDLPPTWQTWVKNARPRKGRVRSKIGTIIAQARQRVGMEQRTTTELDEAMLAFAVLDKAFLSCDFSLLVVVTDDPAYQGR